ncbi:MAG: GNAT family N-acetyltransferase [Bacteroidetes bacterium]|nr:GNAT family N-acetyltransferase [Bacteroidota bacterium]
MIRISSDRLLIRPLRIEDSRQVYAYRSNPDVVRYQMWCPTSEQEVKRFIREQRGLAPGMPGIWYQFAIIESGNDRLIGDCGVLVPIDEPDVAELGLTLHPESQGKGFATEALQALIDYCFHTLHVHCIIARTHPDNSRSLALLRNCRFSRIPSGQDVKKLIFILQNRNHTTTD